MARIVQHETDHLDGTLFIDRLGPAPRVLDFRDQLEEFEFAFQSKRDTNELPNAEEMAGRLRELERLRTRRVSPTRAKTALEYTHRVLRASC